MRAVFDCMILFQAAANRKGASGACLTLAEEGHVELFLSPAILQEVDDVLHRTAIRSSFPKLTDDLIETFMAELRGIAKIEGDAAPVYRLVRDPDDEPYVNLAIAKQPSFIVTWDGRHLLPLMDDDDFRKWFPGVTILQPPAFLARVRAEIVQELGYE